jgi:hypothetical protein
LIGNALSKSQFLPSHPRNAAARTSIGVMSDRNKMMRVILAAIALSLGTLAFGSGPALAQMNYPWCSITSGIGTECTHSNLSECRFDVHGVGGWCSRNSGYKRG